MLVSRRQRWTWRALDEGSGRLAQGYLDLGLRKGDRIASLMPNRCELLIHYIACLQIGLVAMPLNYRYMAPEIDHALGVGGALALLAHDERRQDLAKSALAAGLPLGCIGYDDENDGGPSTFGTLCETPIGSPFDRVELVGGRRHAGVGGFVAGSFILYGSLSCPARTAAGIRCAAACG